VLGTTIIWSEFDDLLTIIVTGAFEREQ